MCDLPIVNSLLTRKNVDVLKKDSFGKTARDLALETSQLMYQGDTGLYNDDCDSVMKLLEKRERRQKLAPIFQQHFVDEVNRRRATEHELSQQGEQSLPPVLSNIVGEYIVPQQAPQRQTNLSKMLLLKKNNST